MDAFTRFAIVSLRSSSKDRYRRATTVLTKARKRHQKALVALIHSPTENEEIRREAMEAEEAYKEAAFVYDVEKSNYRKWKLRSEVAFY